MLAKLGTQLDGIRGGELTIASKEDAEYLRSRSGMVDAEELTPTPEDTDSPRDDIPILGLGGGDGVLSSSYTTAGWFGQRRTGGKYAQVDHA
ncbi:unnamed protein product [Fusarium venenatum]|uniref:Uncharacterized protein n=1 Tax=Fusarium venenatum TaxID=56646 RepID=A0A2L2TE91_9HYPO|nr:uncharacterized protein FVRRES_12563 [Fusarium venenatum]CEI39872.1 unnamed protein product [Fusarium venenatum]